MKIDDIIDELRKIKGVVDVKLLDDSTRSKIEEIEKNYSETLVKGLGKPYNLGVFECLKRKYVIVLLTNEEFEWPKGPYTIIKLANEVIAEINKKGMKIFHEKIANLRKCTSEPPKAIFLTLKPTDEIKRIIPNAILASPSPPTDSYLKKLFKLEEVRTQNLGTMLVAFD